MIGIGVGGHFFTHANSWFTDSSGAITGLPGFIASLVVLAVIGFVCVLPTRTFHRVVTALAGFGVACFFAMFIFGLLFTHRHSFNTNLPHYTGGVTAAKIAASGKEAFLPGTSYELHRRPLLDDRVPADARRCCCSSSSASSTRRTSPARCAATCAAAC